MHQHFLSQRLQYGYARIHGAALLSTTYGVGELSAINGVMGSKAHRLPVFHLVGMPSEGAPLEIHPAGVRAGMGHHLLVGANGNDASAGDGDRFSAGLGRLHREDGPSRQDQLCRAGHLVRACSRGIAGSDASANSWKELLTHNTSDQPHLSDAAAMVKAELEPSQGQKIQDSELPNTPHPPLAPDAVDRKEL